MKKKFLFIALFLFLGVLFFLSVFLNNYFSPKQEDKRVSVYFLGKEVVLYAELAVTPEERERGLMWRDSLPPNNAMLFIFDGDDYLSFWMKNTKIPLDIVFVSSDFRIVDIKKSFLPCVSVSCSSYMSIAPAKYVIEANAGFSDSNNVNIGDIVNFNIR